MSGITTIVACPLLVTAFLYPIDVLHLRSVLFYRVHFLDEVPIHLAVLCVVPLLALDTPDAQSYLEHRSPGFIKTRHLDLHVLYTGHEGL